MKAGSNLERMLENGSFAVTGEVGPPKSCNGDVVRHHAKMLKGWCESFNLTDNQTAIVRLSSISAGKILLEEGCEPNIQIVCRDRNRIAIQSDVLGAAALGIKNILCLSGDHQKFGNHPTAKNVYDVDSIQLIKILDGMRNGYFANGEEMKDEPPKIFIGCAANPFADPFEFRVTRLEKKADAGADFCQTQCVLDMERFERWMELVRARGLHKRIKILAGITPLKSVKVAKYMNNHVAGMMVSEEYINRLEHADDPKIEGINIAVEQIQHLKKIEGLAGVH
ncbi:MAG TPA: methylenetetrahydrofolate reductase, partial [Desulfobacteria bacterium]|nr:methylenetetrahydrofolate reductase [Desulfobacteria bacterium]